MMAASVGRLVLIQFQFVGGHPGRLSSHYCSPDRLMDCIKSRGKVQPFEILTTFCVRSEWIVSYLVGTLSPSQPQRITLGLKQASICLLLTMHKIIKPQILQNHKINPDSNLHKIASSLDTDFPKFLPSLFVQSEKRIGPRDEE